MSAIQQMIDEMQRRGYARKTIAEYSGSVRRLASYFGRCPAELTLEQLRDYQVHLAKRNDISTSYYNATVTALRFLYLQTLGRDWPIERIPYARREHPLPVVLSRQEVFQLWRPLREPKRRLLLMTAYSAGLRSFELVHLRVEDLDRQKMQIRVQSSGRKHDEMNPRFVPYSPTLAKKLAPYLAKHDSPWLFPGSSKARLGRPKHLYSRGSLGADPQDSDDLRPSPFRGCPLVGIGSRLANAPKGSRPWVGSAPPCATCN